VVQAPLPLFLGPERPPDYYHNFMTYKYFIPFVVGLALWLLSQIFFFFPVAFYSSLALGALLIVFSVRYFARRSPVRHWPLFLIAPLFFFLSFSVYASLLTGRFWVQFIFLLDAWFVANYLHHLSAYFVDQSAAREKKLESLLLNGVWLTVLAVAASLFGLPAFINTPFYLLVALFLLVVFFLWIQLLPLVKVKFRSAAPVLFVSLAVLGALVEAISLFPLNFNILGFLVAIFAYFLLTVNRLFWQGNLNRRALKWPLVLSIILTILSLLTARWL